MRIHGRVAGAEQSTQTAGTGVARLLVQQADRVAAAWRRVRCAQQPGGALAQNLLDDVVEPFVRAVGKTLSGELPSAWTRTGGVLRLSPQRGARQLHEEFQALRRCLVDALEVLGGSEAERLVVEHAVDEALDSSVALLQRMVQPQAKGPRVPFGGLVVECFESRPASHADVFEESGSALH